MATKLDAQRSKSDPQFRPEWETPEGGIPVSHYISQEYADLEAKKLWPHAWQLACHMDEVARPGDYTVYEIVDQSVLVIRVDENTIKAYHNVCPHRATALAQGSGRFSTGEITCPFHGWRWNLNGDNTFVLDRDEFKGGCLSDEDVKLRECEVATWIGCVFINMDKDAISLEEYMAPVQALIDPILIDKMYLYWWKSVVVPCNWKVAQEAFHEAYHVPQTHPQLGGREALQGGESYGKSTLYEAMGNGHGRFYSAPQMKMNKEGDEENSRWQQSNDVDQLVASLTKLWEGMDAMVFPEEVNIAKSMRHRPIPEGSNLAAEFGKAVYEHYANVGRPIAAPEALSNVGDMLLFPNFTLLPSFGNMLAYRSRPTPENDPDLCIFELFSFKTKTEGETPPRPKMEHCTDPTDAEQYWLIPRQDFSNIPRMQQGLHSRGITQTLLSGRQEVMIDNMHRELNRYLKR